MKEKISEKLNIIDNAKNDIKTAIENKGISVGDVGIQNYASKIDEMNIATPPAKGIIINEFDSNGYPTDVSVVGLTEIPSYYLYYGFRTNNMFSKIGANLHLPTDLISIGTYAFYNSNGLALTELPEGLTSIANYAFYGCTKLALTELPEGITSIGTYAFHSCTNLALTELPEGLTSIANYAFYGCTKLTLTSLPEGITSIGDRSFLGCDSLTVMTLPSTLTLVDEAGFSGCDNLQELIFLGNLKTLKASCFNQCSKLSKIVLSNVTEVPTLANTNVFLFTPIASKAGYIYVPDTLVTQMQSASNWSKYASQIKGLSELPTE